MTVHEEKLKRILCEAIENRQSIRFYYESKSSGKKGWRIVEPYIIGTKRTGNVFLAGMPVEERIKSIDEGPQVIIFLKKLSRTK
jgi:hypothetical protein